MVYWKYFRMIRLLVLCVFTFFAEQSNCRSAGPPVDACDDLVPGHSQANRASDLPGTFYIYTELLNDGNDGFYEPSTTYQVTIASSTGRQFLGFFIQARDASDGTTLIGSFNVIDSENSRLVPCSGNNQASIGHPNNNAKTRVSMQWTSPSTAGQVEFRYTVVTGFTEDYYSNLNATNYRPTCPILPTEVNDYAIQVRRPDGCSGDSCDYIVGLSPNAEDPNYIDVYLDGMAQGWVAVGFSMNEQMDDDDVLGCRYNGTMVTAVDTWNPSRDNNNMRTANIADDTQDDIICTHSATMANGRITCSFSRLVNGTDDGQDYDLNNSLYLLYGRRIGSQSSGDNLEFHQGETPGISFRTLNAVADTFRPTTTGPNITCPPTPASDVVYTFQVNNPGDDYYLATRVNPDNSLYLDFRLEGQVPGWVAVGLSDNEQMDSDDVLGCIRDPNSDTVAVVDAYNPSPQYTANRRDQNQTGVCTHETNFDDGRITCTFSRLIEPLDSFDRNLNQSWFLLFGTHDGGGSSLSSFPQHSDRPQVSTSRSNLILDTSASASNFPRDELLKVHGILMLITWPLLAVTAIFFAAWMKPALPNGEWFQVHRLFMIVALFVGAAGFIFAFVANADNATPGLISFACNENRAHFALGIIVFLLQIVNPIIAAFRCNPTAKNRWIFNLSHGTLIGFIVELLALANIGIGIALFEAGGCNVLDAGEYTILWVYIGFVIFLLILQVVLFVVFTVLAFNVDPKVRPKRIPSLFKYFYLFGNDSGGTAEKKSIEMTDPTKKEEKPSNQPPPRKPPSEDAPVRWVGFGVFMFVTLALILAVIILIIIQ